MPNSVFVRKKRIKGNEYAYLVRNTWSKNGSRQKVNKYLGRIYAIPKHPKPKLPEDTPPQFILQALANLETAHEPNTKIDIEHATVKHEGKSVVLALNEGYLCPYTIKKLKRALHTRNEERPGLALAEALTRAGLRISQDAFIRLYKEYQP